MTVTALAIALVSTIGLSGCGGNGGVDIEFNAPILEAAGVNLSSKKKDESDLPERPGLVVPPSTATLPPPGERTAAAQQNWPADKEQIKKAEADAQAAERDRYCREGNWNGKGGIDEFHGPRCPSKIGEAISKSIGGGPQKDQ
jgi:hypothetical protein